MKLHIANMTCVQCQRAITRALHGIDPKATVVADLGNKTVSITGAIDLGQAVVAISEAGYAVSTTVAAAKPACGCCRCGDCRCVDCTCCDCAQCKCAA